MKGTRPYTQRARAAATQATRARILDAAKRAFLEDWYEDITLQSIARAAGVSHQTVLNHFGGKDALFTAATAALSADIVARRDGVAPGDVRGAIEALIADYEVTGDATIRALASELRLPSLEPQLDAGRAAHRAWVQRVLAPAPEHLPALIVATDVYAWKLLRRDQGLPVSATVAAILALVSPLVPSPPAPEE